MTFDSAKTTNNVLPETVVYTSTEMYGMADEPKIAMSITWSVDTVNLQYERLSASNLRFSIQLEPSNLDLSTWISIAY